MRYLKYDYIDAPEGTPIHYVELLCLSTDSKPTENIAMGSIATEVDTGDVYFYNEDDTEWVKQFSFQE